MLRVLVEPALDFKGRAPSGVGFESGKDVHPCEVVILAPYFLEYRNYIEKNQGRVRVAFSDHSFRLDFDEIEKNITESTRAIILNSPNNPTGVLYREDELEELARILEMKNREFNSTICVIEDGSYAQLLFENSKLPSMMPYYRYNFFVSSFSKSLGIAGERLGYIAAHPHLLDSEDDWSLLQQVISVNIRMTVVDAPVLQQRVVEKIGCEKTVDISVYQRRVSKLADTLKDLGFEFTYPEGAFYIFARIPKQFTDGEEFQKAVQLGDEPILFIPGYAFGGEHYNDYVRFSVCVDDRTINRACEQLARICRHM
jgi:aspartate aminotransferase